jgi:4a-hydroxytetrahydrobiopterin dehydratase
MSPSFRPQPLAPDTLAAALAAHGLGAAGWHLANGELVKQFAWPNFHATMAFVNAVAAYAHQADHHPTLVVTYGHCEVRWSTHEPLGITELDVAGALATQALGPTA